MGNKIQSVGEVVEAFLRENNLEQKLSEVHLTDYWKYAVGTMVVSYTKSLELNGGVLYAKISNSALRNELFIRRFDIVKRVNEAAHFKMVTDLRLS